MLYILSHQRLITLRGNPAIIKAEITEFLWNVCWDRLRHLRHLEDWRRARSQAVCRSNDIEEQLMLTISLLMREISWSLSVCPQQRLPLLLVLQDPWETWLTDGSVLGLFINIKCCNSWRVCFISAFCCTSLLVPWENTFCYYCKYFLFHWWFVFFCIMDGDFTISSTHIVSAATKHGSFLLS